MSNSSKKNILQFFFDLPWYWPFGLGLSKNLQITLLNQILAPNRAFIDGDEGQFDNSHSRIKRIEEEIKRRIIFLSLMCSSLALNITEKIRLVIVYPTLSNDQVDGLLEVFRDEQEQFHKIVEKEANPISRLIFQNLITWSQIAIKHAYFMLDVTPDDWKIKARMLHEYHDRINNNNDANELTTEEKQAFGIEHPMNPHVFVMSQSAIQDLTIHLMANTHQFETSDLTTEFFQRAFSTELNSNRKNNELLYEIIRYLANDPKMASSLWVLRTYVIRSFYSGHFEDAIFASKRLLAASFLHTEKDSALRARTFAMTTLIELSSPLEIIPESKQFFLDYVFDSDDTNILLNDEWLYYGQLARWYWQDQSLYEKVVVQTRKKIDSTKKSTSIPTIHEAYHHLLLLMDSMFLNSHDNNSTLSLKLKKEFKAHMSYVWQNKKHWDETLEDLTKEGKDDDVYFYFILMTAASLYLNKSNIWHKEWDDRDMSRLHKQPKLEFVRKLLEGIIQVSQYIEDSVVLANRMYAGMESYIDIIFRSEVVWIFAIASNGQYLPIFCRYIDALRDINTSHPLYGYQISESIFENSPLSIFIKDKLDTQGDLFTECDAL